MRPWALPTPHPTRSQDSRVFSSETPGNEAVLILPLLVLAWVGEGGQRRSEGAGAPAGPQPAEPHPVARTLARRGLRDVGTPDLSRDLRSFWKVRFQESGAGAWGSSHGHAHTPPPRTWTRDGEEVRACACACRGRGSPLPHQLQAGGRGPGAGGGGRRGAGRPGPSRMALGLRASPLEGGVSSLTGELLGPKDPLGLRSTPPKVQGSRHRPGAGRRGQAGSPGSGPVLG